MKKILILANNSGGLYDFRHELVEELLKEAEVYASTPFDTKVEELKQTGCKLIETAVDRRGMNPLNDLKLMNFYKRLIKAIKPDVVVTYTIKPNVYGGYVCRRLKVPYLANITGLGTSIMNGGLLSKLSLFMYRLGVKGANCLFFQNTGNKAFMESKNVRGKSNRLLPGSGVNTQENVLEPYPKDDGTVRFLNVQRVMKDKGIEELLYTVRKLTEKYPNAQFSIAGDYDEEVYRPEIEKLETEGKLKFLGYRTDMHNIMSEYHAIIHPSYHEGLSNILLEAAACGRPVIASNVPGCRETFDEGISGFGAEARSAESLTEAVEKFLALPYEEKRQMGLNGRKKIEKEFDRKLVIEAYQDEIQKIIKQEINQK